MNKYNKIILSVSIVFVAFFTSGGCGGGGGGGDDNNSALIVFEEVNLPTGIDFLHIKDGFFMPIGCSPAVGDYNNDGFVDIYFTNSAGDNKLYRNNGDSTFTDVAESVGLPGPAITNNGAGWADYDNDGDLDLFIAAYGTSKLFNNSGDPGFTFTDVTEAAGVGDEDPTLRSTGVAWGDYDQDGYLDLLVVRHFSEDDPLGILLRSFLILSRPLVLYHNNGDGTFTDVTDLLGDGDIFPSVLRGAGFKPGFLDYDNDGDPDIYIVNDFGRDNQPNVLWRNDGADMMGGWKFTDVSVSSGAGLAIFGMGLAVGDYDNDGWLDMYMTDIGDNELLHNEGDGTFTNQKDFAGVARGELPDGKSVTWGTGFADFNNDGYLDIYLTAGFLDSDAVPFIQPNAVFQNNGDGTFADVSATSNADDTGIGRGLEIFDFNNDGLMDVLICNLGTKEGAVGVAKLFKNITATNGNWLEIVTIGTASNRDGIGARITLTTDTETMIREVGSSQSHMSQTTAPTHFGLGSAVQANSINIVWPSGAIQNLENVAANQFITVTEP